MRTPLDLINNPPPELKILVSTFPELDFPLVKPDQVLPCGPILRIAPPITDADRELEKWLARGPTIYLNLGSLVKLSEDKAVEFALALKTVLDEAKQHSSAAHFQVLWKLMKCEEYEVFEPGCRIYEILGTDIEADKVKIVSWIQAEPIEVLQSGHVACSVHHGGANTYNEAVV